jgi:hypothetical protein
MEWMNASSSGVSSMARYIKRGERKRFSMLIVEEVTV